MSPVLFHERKSSSHSPPETTRRGHRRYRNVCGRAATPQVATHDLTGFDETVRRNCCTAAARNGTVRWPTHLREPGHSLEAPPCEAGKDEPTPEGRAAGGRPRGPKRGSSLKPPQV